MAKRVVAEILNEILNIIEFGCGCVNEPTLTNMRILLVAGVRGEIPNALSTESLLDRTAKSMQVRKIFGSVSV